MNRHDTVVVLRPALRDGEPFVPALRVPIEVHASRRSAVVLANELECNVVGLLELSAAEILQLLLVQAELRRCRIREAAALVARIAAEGRVARGHGMRIGRARETHRQCIDEGAIVPASPDMDGLGIPAPWKIDLEADRLGLRIDRLDGAIHLAIIAILTTR